MLHDICFVSNIIDGLFVYVYPFVIYIACRGYINSYGSKNARSKWTDQAGPPFATKDFWNQSFHPFLLALLRSSLLTRTPSLMSNSKWLVTASFNQRKWSNLSKWRTRSPRGEEEIHKTEETKHKNERLHSWKPLQPLLGLCGWGR